MAVLLNDDPALDIIDTSGAGSLVTDRGPDTQAQNHHDSTTTTLPLQQDRFQDWDRALHLFCRCLRAVASAYEAVIDALSTRKRDSKEGLGTLSSHGRPPDRAG